MQGIKKIYKEKKKKITIKKRKPLRIKKRALTSSVHHNNTKGDVTEDRQQTGDVNGSMLIEDEVMTVDSSSDDYIAGDEEDDVSTDVDEDILDGLIIPSTKVFNYQQCFNHTVETDIMKALYDFGFEHHFTKDIGGSTSPNYVKTWSRRLSRFLNYTYHSIHNSALENNKVGEWIKSIITTHHKEIFPKYITHLRETLELSPSTILVELYDIKKFMDWFVYIRAPSNSEDNNNSANMECLRPFEYVLSNICKSERKRLKRQQSDNQSLETLVENRQLPMGGLHELQECLHEDLIWVKSWASNLISNSNTNYIGQQEYNKFMQILYATLYIHSPQGRISGIESIKCKQIQELLEGGVTFSTNFKTSSTYGYQPVTTSKLSRKLLHIYVTYVRPTVNRYESENDNTTIYFNQPLFLHYNGSPATRIGDKV